MMLKDRHGLMLAPETRPIAPSDYDELKAVLLAQDQLAQKLIALAAAERRAIALRAIDELLQIEADKSDLARRLAEAELHRLDWMRRFVVADRPDCLTLTELIAILPRAYRVDLLALSRDLKRHVLAAADGNKNNGFLLISALRLIQRAMRGLPGARGDEQTYDFNGPAAAPQRASRLFDLRA